MLATAGKTMLYLLNSATNMDFQFFITMEKSHVIRKKSGRVDVKINKLNGKGMYDINML